MNYKLTNPLLLPGLYFMAVGPLVGLALVLIGLLVVAIPEIYLAGMNDVLEVLKMMFIVLIYGFFTAYTIGALPALITGAIAGRGKTNAQQIFYAIIVGALSCVLISLLVLMNRNLFFNIGAGVLGGVSGVCCMALQQRRVRKLNQR